MTDEVVDAEEVAKSLASNVAQSVLYDDQWRTFGFKGTPRRGFIWDLFVSKERLALEQFLFREFAILAIAQTARVLQARFDPEWAVPITARVLSSLLADRGVRRCFSFDTLQDGLDYVKAGVQRYVACEPATWTSVLLNRAPRFDQKKYNARMFVGAALTMEPSRSIVPHVATTSNNICATAGLRGRVKLPQDIVEPLVEAADAIVKSAAASPDGGAT